MKNIRTSGIALIIAGFLLCPLLRAEESRYFAVDYEVVLSQIPPPPADDSIAGMADIETVLQVQRDRTPEQIARAKKVNAHNAMSMGAHVFGPEFTKQNLPKTAGILSKATKERGNIVRAGKKQWNRTRPYDRKLGVEPCLERQVGTSYPSGHSSSGAFWATLYSAAMPEYRTLFAEQMRETMWSRVLGGVHYPTDTQAGKMLGTLIAQQMLKNPLMQEDIKIIREEILDFLKKNPQAATHAEQLLKKTQ